MWNIIRPAVVSFITLTVITGVIYPLAVTGVAKLAFASQADGSVLLRDGKAIGSSLIAQPFTDAKYFWPRPSAAGANGYDATSGSGSNLAPSNPALTDAVAARVAALRAIDPGNTMPVPVDLVTASGSGLDPHISVAAATYQRARVARARGLNEAQVQAVIDTNTESLGLLSEHRVNVLELNLALDHPLPATTASAEDADKPFGYRAMGFIPDAK